MLTIQWEMSNQEVIKAVGSPLAPLRAAVFFLFFVPCRYTGFAGLPARLQQLLRHQLPRASACWAIAQPVSGVGATPRLRGFCPLPPSCGLSSFGASALRLRIGAPTSLAALRLCAPTAGFPYSSVGRLQPTFLIRGLEVVIARLVAPTFN